MKPNKSNIIWHDYQLDVEIYLNENFRKSFSQGFSCFVKLVIDNHHWEVVNYLDKDETEVELIDRTIDTLEQLLIRDATGETEKIWQNKYQDPNWHRTDIIPAEIEKVRARFPVAQMLVEKYGLVI